MPSKGSGQQPCMHCIHNPLRQPYRTQSKHHAFMNADLRTLPPMYLHLNVYILYVQYKIHVSYASILSVYVLYKYTYIHIYMHACIP